MRNIKLTIQYDGTNYSGWQFQKNAKTIQEVIQRALKKITGRPVNITASGRTDAGVHAKAQAANFRTRSNIPLQKLQMALNATLPKDIVICDIEEAGEYFNSRHDAKAKLYRYTIANANFVDPLMRRYAARCFYKLNMNKMKMAAKCLVGKHDFKSFQAKNGKESSSVRKICYIGFAKEGKAVYIYIKADGFLYNMARNIVGTLIEVGRGKITSERVKDILASKDRRFSGPTMPAKGLCLEKVYY